MNLLRNAKVKTKLFFMVATSLVFLIIVGGIGVYFLQISNDKMDTMYKDKLLSIEYLEESKAMYNVTNTGLFELMVTRDDKRNSELDNEMKEYKTIVVGNITKYSKMNLDSFEVETLKQLNDNFAMSEKLIGSVMAIAITNKNIEAYEEYNKSLSPINKKIEKNLSDLTDYNIKEADILNQQNGLDFTSARFIILGITLFALIVGALISLFIINLIVKPIISMEAYIQKVAAGDLSKETLEKASNTKLYNDEIGKLGNSIITMREKLWGLLSKVADASEQIAASSQELNANAEESSNGIEETAKSVTNIAGGAEDQLNTVMNTSNVIEKMSSNIQQAEAAINQTATVAEKTFKATKTGEKAINKTKEQMNNIEGTVVGLDGVVKKLGKRSSEIGQIVETISSLAEQTNLLALNAAIEAARAGEHGRGFSVVADEVRKLAEQSQEATEKISSLIGEIQKDTSSAVLAMEEGTEQVKIGMEVVDKAGQAFGDISALVQQITSQIEEIASSSQEISSGSNQVVSSMDKVDEISKEVSNQSQTIAASIEEQSAAMHEIASASEELSKIAENLMGEVAKFKL